MQKYIPSLIPILTAAGIAAAPGIQASLAHHPLVSACVAAAYAVVTHWLPSPTAK